MDQYTSLRYKGLRSITISAENIRQLAINIANKREIAAPPLPLFQLGHRPYLPYKLIVPVHLGVPVLTHKARSSAQYLYVLCLYVLVCLSVCLFCDFNNGRNVPLMIVCAKPNTLGTRYLPTWPQLTEYETTAGASVLIRTATCSCILSMHY